MENKGQGEGSPFPAGSTSIVRKPDSSVGPGFDGQGHRSTPKGTEVPGESPGCEPSQDPRVPE